MPIFRDDDGNTMVVLGTGDIATALGCNKADADGKSREIMLYAGGPHPIGRSAHEDLGRTTTDLGPCVRIRFEKVESLVVFLTQAVALLDHMVGNVRDDKADSPVVV